jgi:hypothetical protein
MRWPALDRLITAATGDAADVLSARDEWSGLTGLVHSDHELYGERSDAFVEWYVLERCGADGLTPVDRLLREPGAIPEADRPAVVALGRSYRSLFQVHRLGAGAVTIDDLLGGGRFEVDERRRLPGVVVGDLFEARLLPDPDEPVRLLFSRTFLFHPREAQKAVRAHAERARRQGEPRSAVLFRLQRLRLRCTAYKHVPAQRIYAQQDALP